MRAHGIEVKKRRIKSPEKKTKMIKDINVFIEKRTRNGKKQTFYRIKPEKISGSISYITIDEIKSIHGIEWTNEFSEKIKYNTTLHLKEGPDSGKEGIPYWLYERYADTIDFSNNKFLIN